MAEIDPSWYYRAGGGPLPDVGVYSLQLITSVLGPVRRVTAFANRGSTERAWKGKTIPVTINDNNLVMLEFASGALGVAPGSDCRGSARIPWGGMGLYGTQGALEVTEVDFASGYPIKFEVQGGAWPQSQAGADPRDPRQNVEAGTQYLRDLLFKYQNDDHQVSRALAAYNAGPGAVDRYRGVPPYRETRAYVARVLREYEKKQAKAAGKPTRPSAD